MLTHFSAPAINKVLIIGSLVCEPKFSVTNGNKIKVVNFRIACPRIFREKTGNLKQEHCYVSVTAWARIAEICEDNLVKGDKVYVEGSLQSRQIGESKTSIVEIHADKVQILTVKKIVTNKEDKFVKCDKENIDECCDQSQE